MKTSKSVIGALTQVEGLLSGEDDLLILGSVEGEISTSGTILIERTGTVLASVEGHAVEVRGQVEGDLEAIDLVELKPEARMDGNIKAHRILIADGARFKGNVDMDRSGTREDGKEDDFEL